FPASGRINVAVPDPTDPNVMYVAGDDSGAFGSGSGIWKTTNWLAAVPTWTPLIDNQPSLDIWVHGLVMAPSDHNTLYAAANGPNGNILVSTDAGADWTAQMTNPFANAHFGAIAVDNLDSNLIYVAVKGDLSGASAGIYRSTDGGQTFTPIALPSGDTYFATDLALAPRASLSDPETLFTGVVNDTTDVNENGVYRITDNGSTQTWVQQTTGITLRGAGIGDYIQLALSPVNANILYG